MRVIGESTSSSLVAAEYNQSDLISKCKALLTSAHSLDMMKVENGDFKIKGGGGMEVGWWIGKFSLQTNGLQIVWSRRFVKHCGSLTDQLIVSKIFGRPILVS